jgi:phosphoribosylamine---glycine ligase
MRARRGVRSALSKIGGMRILLVGSGGREHALAQALASSPTCSELHCAPGNPGIARLAACHDVAVDDLGGLVALAQRLAVELVVIGPELPLVLGLGDALRRARIPVFGPSSGAALVEGSKAFSKKLMAASGVPTARYWACTDVEAARRAVDELGGACVVKADGLAAGKGVTVCVDREAALAAIEASLIGGAFGEAGATVVIEELLVGDEVSLLALCHGQTARPLAAAQDFKRVGDGDTGPNTGGMGAYSPVPWFDSAATAEAARLVHEPLLAELARRGIPFSGCLYAGLMLTADGPRVLEYNVRFGDPETQALVARLDGDLAVALAAIARGAPEDVALGVRGDAAVTLVLAAPGYPEATRTGQPIEGIERAEALEGVTVQHAGTAMRDGRLVVAGGRVLGVTAVAPSLSLARERAMAGARQIEFDGKQVRSDIALRAAQEAERV